jgi:hypothetical protein
MTKWLKMVLTIDAIAIGIFVMILFALGNMFDVWALFAYDFTNAAIMSSLKLGLTVAGFLVVHFTARAFSAKVVAKKLVSNVFADKSLAGEHREGKILAGSIKKAFLKNTQPLRSIFRPMPVGWSMRSKRTLAQVAADACDFIQTMNDRYTKPSGIKSPDAETAINPVPGEDVVPDADMAASVEPLSAVKSETK